MRLSILQKTIKHIKATIKKQGLQEKDKEIGQQNYFTRHIKKHTCRSESKCTIIAVFTVFPRNG